MSASTKGLVEYGRFLRNAAPQAYSDFVDAFAGYTRDSIDTLVNTTGDLPLAQGRAQQCLKILRTLEEIRNAN